MKKTLRLMAVSAFALLISTAAFAQTPEASVLPITEPTDVGGTILQPGTYTIRVLPSFVDRNKVQITSQDGQTVYATVLTVPHPFEPGETTPNTMFVYFPAGNGQPRALRTWFAQFPEASQGGHDIVYEESRAKELARLADSRVVAYKDDIAVAELETTPLEVVTPQATIETYTVPTPVVVETTPAMTSNVTETREEAEMPATASNLPLMALLGLLSIAGALAFRMVRPQ